VEPAPEHRSHPLYRALGESQIADPGRTVQEVREQAMAHAKEPLSDVHQEVVDRFLEDHYERALRFGKAEDTTPKTVPDKNWMEMQANGKWSSEVVKAGMKHMSGDKAHSPFVSTATSEGALLKAGDSWVDNITFGVNPEMKAPSISHFRVPRRALVTPETIESTFDVTGGTTRMDLHRSKNETEALFYGTGLERYLTHTRPNPYTPEEVRGWKFSKEDMAKQEQLEKETHEKISSMEAEPPTRAELDRNKLRNLTKDENFFQELGSLVASSEHSDHLPTQDVLKQMRALLQKPSASINMLDARTHGLGENSGLLEGWKRLTGSYRK
jgi:hypothetical protein